MLTLLYCLKRGQPVYKAGFLYSEVVHAERCVHAPKHDIVIMQHKGVCSANSYKDIMSHRYFSPSTVYYAVKPLLMTT